MHEGFAESGVFVNADKTRLNFEPSHFPPKSSTIVTSTSVPAPSSSRVDLKTTSASSTSSVRAPEVCARPVELGELHSPVSVSRFQAASNSADMPQAEYVRWNGLAIDVQRLHVRADYSKLLESGSLACSVWL
jgi:hypothetical protein